MFYSRRCFVFVIAMALLLVLPVGCTGPNDDLAPEPTTSSLETNPAGAATQYLTLFRFEGFSDPSTGEISVWAVSESGERLEGDLIRVEQELEWGQCPVSIVADGRELSGPPGTAELHSVGDSGFDSECGTDPLYPILGAFCSTVRFTSFYSGELRNVYAVIDEMRPATGHAGWDSDPAPYLRDRGGEEARARRDLGIWYYGNVLPHESSSVQWTFENFDGGSHTFSGEVIALFEEQCGDGIDNNCNQIVDEGCQVCGDGNLDLGEQCDDGNNATEDGCNPDCRLTTATCGDGDVSLYESCDDGGTADGDGCSADCLFEGTTCGDEEVEGLEECDDGNSTPFDGCTPGCRLEACGNHNDATWEECDDGNRVPFDGCSEHCTIESCGDGIVDPGEECDDGNNVPLDGCSPGCGIELCGDGTLDFGEQCDFGDLSMLDGCNSFCKLELCGNGLINGSEECDDGNTSFADGCSPTCTTDVLTNGDFGDGLDGWTVEGTCADQSGIVADDDIHGDTFALQVDDGAACGETCIYQDVDLSAMLATASTRAHLRVSLELKMLASPPEDGGSVEVRLATGIEPPMGELIGSHEFVATTGSPDYNEGFGQTCSLSEGVWQGWSSPDIHDLLGDNTSIRVSLCAPGDTHGFARVDNVLVGVFDFFEGDATDDRAALNFGAHEMDVDSRGVEAGLVENFGGPPNVVIEAVPSSGLSPLHVDFSVSCPGCAEATWDFGDGSSETSTSGGTSSRGFTVSHIYPDVGAYRTTVTVRNLAGFSSSASLIVNSRSGSCLNCHQDPQDNLDGIPEGGRRAVTPEFGLLSHHLEADTASDVDCYGCHNLRSHGLGVVQLGNADNPSVVYDWPTATAAERETFCVSCHDDDGAAAGDGTTPFVAAGVVPSIEGWSGSAHQTGGTACDGCHGASIHGSANERLLQESSVSATCLGCHTDPASGGISNPSLSAGLADDIEESMGLATHHDMGSTFDTTTGTFTLECTSCHNPHIVTGGHWEVDQPGVTPVTRPDFSDPVNNPRAMGDSLWGAAPEETIQARAGSGTYRTPNGDLFDGDELPDYVTLCLDCHAQPQEVFGTHGGISWGNDEPHGANSANQPNGGGACPNWYGCGKAWGWDLDTCMSEEDCWPVIPRGYGDQLFSRLPYNHDERVAGANFYLDCTDCHEAHGSSVSGLLRSVVNNQPGSWVWNTECNACHYYYSDWHAGMSCGTASCHVQNSIHGMRSNTGSSGTRGFEPDLVLDYAFEGNLRDSGDFRLHGIFREASGSFAAGRFGSAVVVNDTPIEVGTENEHWSTHAGRHGTWKYTEMKYVMTLEAWVYPTADTENERRIIAKHTYWSGGYSLLLKNVDGRVRAALLTNMTGGAPDYENWDGADCNGLRGAYSTVEIPQNQWTHIAATYAHTGPDRDPADLSVGRVRIYVNGEDVTTSYATVGDCLAQPGPGEDAMFPFSDHSGNSEEACYLDHWCASSLSVGGLNWSAPNDNFIGRMDELKVWNITQDASYFDTADEQSPPRLDSVTGIIGMDTLTVNFTEGVSGSADSTTALTLSDLVLTDIDNSRTIVGLTHDAGAASAIVTLSSPMDASEDINVDTITAVVSSIYDEYGNSAAAIPVVVAGDSACPTEVARFDLNEAAGTEWASGGEGMLAGLASDAQVFQGDGFFHGDGVDSCVDFESHDNCLQVTDTVTLEVRIRTGTIGTDPVVVQRLFARDTGGGNYQMSLWRNNTWSTYNAPDDVASIAFWARVIDPLGGTNWQVGLTDYTAFPVVSDHWYRVRAVWDSGDSGLPVAIYLDDQGPDGDDVGQLWSGYVNAIDSDQSQSIDGKFLYPGFQILGRDGDFTIGCNANNHTKHIFSGLIDWIEWKADADLSGLD